jgi:hypothetical protein
MSGLLLRYFAAQTVGSRTVYRPTNAFLNASGVDEREWFMRNMPIVFPKELLQIMYEFCKSDSLPRLTFELVPCYQPPHKRQPEKVSSNSVWVWVNGCHGHEHGQNKRGYCAQLQSRDLSNMCLKLQSYPDFLHRPPLLWDRLSDVALPTLSLWEHYYSCNGLLGYWAMRLPMRIPDDDVPFKGCMFLYFVIHSADIPHDGKQVPVRLYVVRSGLPTSSLTRSDQEEVWKMIRDKHGTPGVIKHNNGMSYAISERPIWYEGYYGWLQFIQDSIHDNMFSLLSRLQQFHPTNF